MTRKERKRLAIIASCAILWPFDRDQVPNEAPANRADALRKWRGEDEADEDKDEEPPDKRTGYH
jgi:hypothetical protein